MRKQQSNDFTRHVGDTIITLLPDNFSDTGDMHGKKPTERKFNIRIQQQDIFLLDALALHNGTSRSTLINHVLHGILLDELMSIKDLDARALIAATADARANYDELAEPWLETVFSPEFQKVFDNICTYNSPHDMGGGPPPPEGYNSEAFHGLRAKLKGMKP